MNHKTIVFDFDGTIADTYERLIKLANELADEFNYKPISQSELLKLKNLSSWEIIKQAQIPLFKIPFLFKRIQKELSKEIKQTKIFPEIKTVLQKLKARDYQLGIITSNTEKNVINVLANYELSYLFDFIYAETTIFGKHRIIDEVIRTKKIDRGDLIYVGDETRDIRSAQKSRVAIVAVAWGFHSREILAKQKPEFIVDRPLELLDAITQWHDSWQTEIVSELRTQQLTKTV
ncbi:MAG: HAD hydrolase-like protein [Xenococcaceae cyanobacterium]